MDYSCDSNLLFIDWLPSRLAAVKINKMKYGELGCDTRAKKTTHICIYKQTQQYNPPRLCTPIKLNQQTHTHTEPPHTRTIKLEIDFADKSSAGIELQQQLHCRVQISVISLYF
jgi:hypothetical protein